MLIITASRKPGRGASQVTGSTKGDPFRGVEFGPRIAGILLDLRARQSEQKTVDLSTKLVFIDANGEPLDRRRISASDHKHALADAGLRSTLRLHDLRDTAAASWLAAGLPLIYVQRQLGHASISTTERQYGHLEKGFLRRAAERAEVAIWEAQPAARIGGPPTR
jgi:integrase